MFCIIMLIIDRILNTMEIGMYYSYACLLCRFCSGIIAIFLFNSIKTRFQSVLLAIVLLVPVEAINCIIVLPVSLGSIAATQIFDVLIFSGLSCILSIMLYMFILPLFEMISPS